MIEFATAVPPPPAKGAASPPGVAGTGAAGGAAGGDFARALAGVGDVAATLQPALVRLPGKDGATARTADPSPPAAAAVPTPPGLTEIDLQAGLPVLPGLPNKRQPIAGDGKPLPADTTDKDMSKDMIWLLTGMIPPPLVSSVALPNLAVTPAPSTIDGAAAGSASPAQAGLQLTGDIGGPTPHPVPTPAGDVPTGVTIGTGQQGSAVTAVAPAPDAVKADLPPRGDPGGSSNQTNVATAPAAAAAQPVAAVTQPAGQAFAVAIAAAVQSHRDTREPADPRTPPGFASATLEAIHTPAHTPAVAATADAQHGALDLRQDHGLQSMIDRIETLRDDADARDTRIRLVPDALGAVDVSVRKDGERVHVHFAAENPASARLLSDAQPRLADLAEARGIRLGQTTVGAGVDPGAGQPRQHRPAPPPTPAPAARFGADATDSTDHRIA